LGGTVVNLRLPRQEEHFTVEFPPSHFGYHHIALEVMDLDAVHKELVSKGIAFTKKPGMGAYNRNAFFKGPDNILIELMEF
jgi:catechol 2,3-dioxygenase-like lactoylglutathione lyase family enzyme